MKKKVVAFAVLGVVLTSMSGAHADSFSVKVSKTKLINPTSETLTVNVTGTPANQGIYIRLCKGTSESVKNARPEECFGQGTWSSLDASQLAFGAKDLSKIQEVVVQAEFTSGNAKVNCLVDSCGIHIRRDHNGGSTDYSLDRFIPVSFVGAKGETPTASLVQKKNHISITLKGVKDANVVVTVGKKVTTKKYKKESAKLEIQLNKGKNQVRVVVDGVEILSKNVTY
jgi:hypothetical protein